MIKAGIVGATGYAGAELVRLLKRHRETEVVWLGSRSYMDQKFSGIYGNFRNIEDGLCSADDLHAMAKEVDVIFTATPQGYLAGVIDDEILSNAKVIDLSADFRLKDVEVYEKWYGIKHESPQYIEEAVYGLCEINRDKIKTARLVANPGCYTTCSILSAYPLIKDGLIDPATLIVDAKSGTSGAGRGAKTDNLFCEVNENIKAYGVASHRHTPEIEQLLSEAHGKAVTINFTPHLVPMNRGILVTAYASLKEGAASMSSADDIAASYENMYKDEGFIRLLPAKQCPNTRWVEGSNYVDIGFVKDERTNRVIIMAALDNLVKGAAGQAVQNMNIMFGFPETEGIDDIPLFP